MAQTQCGSGDPPQAWTPAPPPEASSCQNVETPAAGGASAPTDKLVNGTYKCYSLAGSTLNYMFMDVKITGAGSYQDKNGNVGKYRMNGTKIVFESGPLTKANAALLTG